MKNPIKSYKNTAFTLIELLVVISIIAILAGIALPAFAGVQLKGAQTKALANAKQIGLACKLYAGDYNGSFPIYSDVANKTAGTDASNTLQTLIPDYLPDKAIFSNPKSAYCKGAVAGDANKLGKGENEWAYVSGLNDTSTSNWPLIADGLKADKLTYDTDETAPGGVWKGKKAIVIRCDASGTVENVNNANKWVNISESDPANIFVTRAAAGAVSQWLGTGITVMNPTTP